MAKFIKLPNEEVVNLDLVFKVVKIGNYVKFIKNEKQSSIVELSTEEAASIYFKEIEMSLTY
jgi:hypothetical protein